MYLLPNRLIPFLSVSCGLLTFSYIALIVTTVFFASWQTDAVSALRNSQSNIATLETQYYSTVNRIDAMSPTALGYVIPKDVTYVATSENTDANVAVATQ